MTRHPGQKAGYRCLICGVVHQTDKCKSSRRRQPHTRWTLHTPLIFYICSKALYEALGECVYVCVCVAPQRVQTRPIDHLCLHFTNACLFLEMRINLRLQGPTVFQSMFALDCSASEQRVGHETKHPLSTLGYGVLEEEKTKTKTRKNDKNTSKILHLP